MRTARRRRVATGANMNNNPASPDYSAPERKMPAGMRIAHKRGPRSKYKVGDVINGHTLVEALGNPALGPTQSYRWACGTCGATDRNIVDAAHINNLNKHKTCRHCTYEHRKPVNAP